MVALLLLLLPCPSLSLLLPSSPALSPLPRSSRTSPTPLTCDHRLYQGYTLRPGDQASLHLPPSSPSPGLSLPSAALCLWKFHATQGCRIAFSCRHFYIPQVSSTCQDKLITKVVSLTPTTLCTSRWAPGPPTSGAATRGRPTFAPRNPFWWVTWRCAGGPLS